MGVAGSKKFLDSEPQDWAAYVAADWRSPRAKELDTLGGLLREPIASGRSVSAKLDFLGKSLETSGQHLSSTLYASGPGRPSAVVPPIRRASEPAENRGTPTDLRAAASDNPQSRSGWNASEVDVRERQRDARRRMLQYGQAQSEMLARPAGPLGRDAQGAGCSTSTSATTPVRLAPSSARRQHSKPASADQAVLQTGASNLVADWRRRVHAARRRTLLSVLVVVRLTRGLRRQQRLGPSGPRLRRIDSYSWYVASVLGGDSGKFVAEQRKYIQARVDLDIFQALLDPVVAPNGQQELGSLPSPDASSPATPHRQAMAADGVLDGVETNGALTSSSSLQRTASSTAVILSEAAQPTSLLASPSAAMGRSGPLRPFRGTAESLVSRRASSPGLGMMRSHGGPQEQGTAAPRTPTFDRAKRLSASGWPDSCGPGMAAARQLNGGLASPRLKPVRLTLPGDDVPLDGGMADLSIVDEEELGLPLSALPEILPRPLSGRRPPCLASPSPRPAASPAEAVPDSPSRNSLTQSSRRASISGVSPRPPSASPHSSWNQQGVGSSKGRRASSGWDMTPRQKRLASARLMSEPLIPLAPTVTAPVVPSGASPAAALLWTGLEGVADQAQQSAVAAACGTFQAQLDQSERLMKMFIHRSNASWAESQELRRPTAWDAEQWIAGSQAAEYKSKVADLVARGQLAIQLFVGDDLLVLPSGHSVDVWSADPWQLLEECRPTRMPAMERIEGVSVGKRALLQLLLAVRGAGGESAVRLLTLVLHVSDTQAGAVMADFIEQDFYGLAQRNVIFVVGPHLPGYRFNAEFASFRRDPLGQGEPLGTGHGLMQCAWPSEALVIAGKDRCELLRSPVLDELVCRGVSWLMSHRLVDLSLLTLDGSLDLALLAYTLYLRERYGVNMAVQAFETDSYVVSRAHDSVIFGRSVPAAAAVGAPGGYKARDVESVVELRQGEMVSPAMNSTMEKVKAACGNKLLVSLKKYAFHIPSLLACLTHAGLFRPKLLMSGELVSVRADLHDVMTAQKACCAAVLAPAARVKQVLATPGDTVHLIPLLQRQDHDGAFRTLLEQYKGSAQEVQLVYSPRSLNDAQHKHKQRIAVLVDSRTAPAISARAVAAAMTIAHPGRDQMFIITVVATEAHQKAGEAFVHQHYLSAIKSTVPTQPVVLVKYPLPLLDTLHFFIQRSGIHTVVMGSANITNMASGTARGGSVFDSVTVACIKRFSIPVVVVTANSTLVAPDQAARDTVRAAVFAERHAKPVTDAVCRHLDPQRGDQLVLVQVLSQSGQLSREQRSGSRHLLEGLADVAAKHRVTIAKRVQAVGKADAVLPQLQLEHKINLVAIQLLPGRQGVTPALLALIASSRCAVMVYGGLHH